MKNLLPRWRFLVAVLPFLLLGAFVPKASAQLPAGVSPQQAAAAMQAYQGKDLNELRKSFEQSQGGKVSIPSPLDAKPATQDAAAKPAAQRKIVHTERPGSSIEMDFSGRAGQPLKQFGYRVFSKSHPATALNGAIGGDYRLGIGDEIVVTFHGKVAKTVASQVDREGRLVLPDLMPIAAAGRSFAEFRRDLQARVKNAMIGTEVFVSIGQVRMISVVVAGEVEAPGLHRLTGLSTVLDALYAAGGVRKTGSLRAIRILRNGERVDFDAYRVLMEGDDRAVTALRDGDRIFVPTLGATLAVAGAVKRPAIFELAAGEQASGQLEKLLHWAGGTIRPQGNRLLRQSLDGEGREHFSELKAGGAAKLVSGDIVQVRMGGLADAGRVRLSGHTRVPGSRSLSTAPTVGALLGSGEQALVTLGREPYLPFAVLKTTDPRTRAGLLQAISLEKVISGEQDYRLSDDDELILFADTQVRFPLGSGCRDLAGPIAGRLIRFSGAQLFSEGDAYCPEIYKQHPGLLDFVLEHLVAVQGAQIPRDMWFPIAQPTPIADIMTFAVGTAVDIDLGGVELTRDVLRKGDDGLSVSQRRRMDLAEIPPAGRLIRPGDALRFKGVRLSGHVRVPGVRSLSSAPTAGALLGWGRQALDTLKEQPYLLFGVLKVTDARTDSPQYRAVNLERVIAGEQDYPLQENDELIVFDRGAIRFTMSAAVQSVLARKQLRKEALEGAAEQGAAQGAATSVLAGRVSSCNSLQELSAMLSSDRSRRFSSAMLALRGDTQAVFPAGGCPAVYEGHEGLLGFVLEHLVAVSGEVRKPGLYPVAGLTPIADLVAFAGGTTRDFDPAQVELGRELRAGAASRIERRQINLDSTPLAEQTVQPGDALRFKPRLSERELGGVLLVGEFAYPGLYDISRGETLSSVVARAGGLTRQAYPYGAVFTRERVKEQERENNRRAAVELQDAMLGMMAQQKEGSGDAVAVAAVGQLVSQLESTPAIGRIVIEADPAVLQARPELDTILEPGDAVYMPKRSNLVSVAGEVLNPGAMAFVPGNKADAYVEAAGGVRRFADDGRIFMVLPNGTARPLQLSFWNYESVQVPPGSTIVVPRDPAPFEFWAFSRDITQLLSNLAITAASLNVISD